MRRELQSASALLILGVTVAMTLPAVSAEISTSPLPNVGSESSVAVCADRILVLPEERGLLAFSRDGTVQPAPFVGRPLFVFSAGNRCLAIDATKGIVDVSSSAATVVRTVSGVLPPSVTAAAQTADGSIWFGVGGSDQIGVIDSAGHVRYFNFPEGDANTGTLAAADLRLAPTSSDTLLFRRDVQLISASAHRIWALRVSTPESAPSYALCFDPRTLAFQRLPLGTNRRFAGLAALSDELGVALTSGDHVLVFNPTGIEMQWELPGALRYVAPPRRVNLVVAVPDGAEIVSLKDAALWRFSRSRQVLELQAQFPGRPSWLTVLANRLLAVNTDAAELMTLPL